MPSKSVAQQRLFQAAEHGANFPAAEKIRSSMTHQQMHEFAVGSEKGKPEHVKNHLHAHAAAHGHGKHAAAYAHGADNQRKGLHKGLHHGGLVHHASGHGYGGPAAEAYAQGAMNEANGMHAQAPEGSPQEEAQEPAAEAQAEGDED